MNLVTNDCLAYFIYNKLGQEYQSPFIGSLFEDDFQFVKFCRGYNKYIKMEPVFGEPQLPVTLMNHKQVPIMFLGDIEIHWPHESKGNQFLLEKFRRRLARAKKPLFIWSEMQMHNRHHPIEFQLLKEGFKKVKNHLFINREDIESQKGKSMDDRAGSNHLAVVKWLDYNLMAEHIIQTWGHQAPRHDIGMDDHEL